MKFLAALLDSDHRAIELHLLSGAAGVATYLGLWIFVVVVRGATFDGASFGTGLAAVMAGTGVAAWGQGLQRKAQGPPA